jgi:hypothetical protein
MTPEEYHNATNLERILYDCTGMLAENHPSIVKTLNEYAKLSTQNAIADIRNKLTAVTTFLSLYERTQDLNLSSSDQEYIKFRLEKQLVKAKKSIEYIKVL